jgi:hypothetical protein
MRHGEGKRTYAEKQCTRGWNDDMNGGKWRLLMEEFRGIGRITTSMDGGAKSIVEVPTFAPNVRSYMNTNKRRLK